MNTDQIKLEIKKLDIKPNSIVVIKGKVDNAVYQEIQEYIVKIQEELGFAFPCLFITEDMDIIKFTIKEIKDMIYKCKEINKRYQKRNLN